MRRLLAGLFMRPTGRTLFVDSVVGREVKEYVDGLDRKWMAFHRFNLFGRVLKARQDA